MKAVTTVLYICGGLMATAAVMGFIDYKAAAHTGKLDKLYKDEEPVTETPKSLVKKEIVLEDYSRGAIPYVEEEKEKTKKQKYVAKAEEEEKVVEEILFDPEPDLEEKPVQEEETKPMVKEEKKFKISEFSRAPLPKRKRQKVVVETIDTTEQKAWDY